MSQELSTPDVLSAPFEGFGAGNVFGFNRRAPGRGKETACQCGYADRPKGSDGFLADAAQNFALRLVEQKQQEVIGKNKVRPLPVNVVDFGTGDAQFPANMVRLNPIIHAAGIDREDNFCAKAEALAAEGRIKKIIKPAQDVTGADLPQYINILSLRRFGSWVDYNQLEILLRKSAVRMPPGSRIFMSVMQFGAPNAGHAAPATVPIRDRHKKSGYHGGTFGNRITCYLPEEFKELLKNAGFEVVKLLAPDDPHKLIKAIGVRARSQPRF